MSQSRRCAPQSSRGGIVRHLIGVTLLLDITSERLVSRLRFVSRLQLHMLLLHEASENPWISVESTLDSLLK